MDQAAPLQGWDLPEEFATLRRLMEVRMNRQGRREYVQILRLLEAFAGGMKGNMDTEASRGRADRHDPSVEPDPMTGKRSGSATISATC
ncbi:transposase (plasmid) [Paracoccus aminophilus JCM 7686]|uniref:Transposase n=1 Tax=Paracoccus aminophilus JCM 7686 TaxID=1367847 RepID=S5XVZ3_PARAH|nr:transposase [Paracoccus aminophilus JCM 7686]